MIIVVFAVIILLVLGFALCKANPHRDDEEQLKYIEEWRRMHVDK